MKNFYQQLSDHEKKWISLCENFEKSEFWLALLHYILDTPAENCVLFNSKKLSMQMEPPPVQLETMIPYDDCDEHFSLGLNLHLADESGDSYETLELSVPYSLVDEFSQDEFDRWISTMYSSRKDMAKMMLLSMMAEMNKDGVLLPSDMDNIKEKFKYIIEHDGEFPEDMGFDDDDAEEVENV